MSAKSEISEIINNQIAFINDDIDALSEEVKVLQSQVYDKYKPMYKSNAGNYQVTRAKLITILSAQEYFKKEIDLYKKAFSKDMIEDIAHIFKTYEVDLLSSIIENIIDARLEIVRFMQQSVINGNDYERNMDIFNNKVDEIKKLAVSEPALMLPKLPHETIKYLIYELNGYRGISVEGGSNAINDDTIKAIVTTITDRKKLPKDHDDFSREMNLKAGWL